MTKIWIGLTGSSGAGKDLVAERIVGNQDMSTLFINCDMFYKPIPESEDKTKWNYDIPTAIDFPLLLKVISDLKAGKKTFIPKWDFNTHSRVTEQHIEIDPDQYNTFLVAGILVLSHDELIKEFDVKVYTDADPRLCLARRKKRDVEERGRTEEDVQRQWDETVYPAFIAHILPVKSRTDVIIVPNEQLKTDINMTPVFGVISAFRFSISIRSDRDANILVAKLGSFGSSSTLQISTANHQVNTPPVDESKTNVRRLGGSATPN